jgi:hypothetical protein
MKASCTTLGISLNLTSVRRSVPSSAMKRPSTAYSLEVCAGVYASSESMEGQRSPLHTRTHALYASPTPNVTRRRMVTRMKRNAVG